MSDLWEDTLLQGALDGIEIDIANRNVKTGRDFTRYKYPYRKGQGVEDLGRKTYVWTLTIPLYAGVSPSHYPGKFDQLLAIIEDEEKRGEVEYIDPELGAFDVKVVDYDWTSDAQARNGATLNVTLEERSFDQDLLQNLSSGKLSQRAAAAKAAQNVGYLLEGVNYADPLDRPLGGFLLALIWAAVQATLDTIALGADQVAAAIDGYVVTSEKVLDFSADDEIGRWSIACATYDAIGAAYAVGDESATLGSGGSLVEYTLADEMTAMEIAQKYYGDAAQASQVMFDNPPPGILYPRGARILVAA